MDILNEAEFWVLIGFLAFFLALGGTGWKLMRGGLDARAQKVRAQLDEAAKLRAEAQALLDRSRTKQEQAVKDAAEIVAAAKDEVEAMRQEAEAELKRTLAAREAQAMDRIAFAEQAAIQSVRTRAVEIAIRAATELVRDSIDGSAANALVDRAIEELPRRARA